MVEGTLPSFCVYKEWIEVTSSIDSKVVADINLHISATMAAYSSFGSLQIS